MLSTSTRSEGAAIGPRPPLLLRPDMAGTWERGEVDFDTAAARLLGAHQADGIARDFTVSNLRGWAIAPVDGHMALVPVGWARAPLMLRSNAYSQLAARIGAPAEFVRDKLPAQLQLATLNWLVQQGRDAGAVLRTRGDDVAALVSERYAALDAGELLDTVRAVLVRLGYLDQVQVAATASGMVDNVRLTFPMATVEPRVGDVTALGVDVSTSAFGRGSLQIRSSAYRLVCTNGMRAPERRGSIAVRHVGSSSRLREALTEAVPAAVAEAQGMLQRWRSAVDVMVEDVSHLVDSWAGILTTPEREAVRVQVAREVNAPALPQHAPLYDVLNAVTRIAHDASPARRLELEAHAGAVLYSRT